MLAKRWYVDSFPGRGYVGLVGRLYGFGASRCGGRNENCTYSTGIYRRIQHETIVQMGGAREVEASVFFR